MATARAVCASWSAASARRDAVAVTPGSGAPITEIRRKPAWLRKPYDRYARRKAPVEVAELLTAVIERTGITDELRAFDLLLRWPAIVGERLASRARPTGLFKRVLWLRVSSSAWMHELSLLKPGLLSAVRAACGPPPLVDDLRFHLGQRKDADIDDPLAAIERIRLARRPPQPRLVPVEARGEDRARIEREASAVEDPELRELVRAVRVRHDR